MSAPFSPGLEGVIAGETGISTLAGGLSYRGYPITELAETTSFEEVAYLLLHGDLPTAAQRSAFQQRVASAQQLPPPLSALLKALPRTVAPMDALRTTVSVLAHFDPDVNDASHAATIRKAERLLGQVPVAIAEQARVRKGLAPMPARADLGHAANFLFMVNGSEPTAAAARALDVSLILYAEHEFNASTFTARVVCSTESDLHSALTAAIGALKGRLHGGANERVMDVLRATGGREGAEPWVRSALARKERIMGFGHRIYKTGDVRADILKRYAHEAAVAAGQTTWEDAAAVVENVLAAEKHLLPNVDWPAGRLYHALGLETPLYTPIFVMARLAGWSAHFLEQQQHNRLIRPDALYNGPARRAVRPLAER